jgi:hypothetical protein
MNLFVLTKRLSKVTMPMVVGLAPYISPTTLQQAPTGIDFTTIPASVDFDPAANNAELWNMCQRATSMADQYCNQLLRASVDIEVHHGPDYRVTVGPQAGGFSRTAYWGVAGGNARVIMSRWPILNVNSVKVSPNAAWPRNWTTLPAGYAEPELPPYAIFNSSAPNDDAYGSQAILIAPGYVDWRYGRNGYILQVSYTNGWPHTALTASASSGATQVTVTDTTGWALSDYSGTITGVTGVVKDGGLQEVVTVTASSTTSGPGTLTLSSALINPHDAGTTITTLPAAIEQACILFCCSQALVRGATSTTIHNVGGHSQSSEGDIMQLNSEAELLLHPYRRVI